MRFVLILLIVLFAALGAIFGALNADAVPYDFYFAVVNFPKGAALLLALLSGWLLGGVLVYFGLVLRLRRRVRAQGRELKRLNAAQAGTPGDAIAGLPAARAS